MSRLSQIARRSRVAGNIREFLKSQLHLIDRYELRELMPLQLNDLFQECGLWTESPEEILRFAGLVVDPDCETEFREASHAIDRRATEVSLPYPKYYDVAPRTEHLLFALVRTTRPQVIVETGIANGRSSAILLAAMDLNGSGILHSVDINDDAGVLVPQDHPRWVKHIGDGSAAGLADVLALTGPVDLFIHDSDHSYRSQIAEYELAQRNRSAQFLLTSDDVNWSYAFLDHCRSHRLTSAVLSDVNKCFGIAWLTETP